MSDKYIAEWEQSKWLTMSSWLFAIPAIYARRNNLNSLAGLLLATSAISSNYWRRATYSWRRNADLIVAKISFIVFFTNGIMYVRRPRFMVIGSIGLLLLAHCYYGSNVLHRLQNPNWVQYHLAFHWILTFEQYIILRSQIEYNNTLRDLENT